jgi:uncharacterized caspase-like protein
MEFAKKAYGADIAVLFYAGHGMQIAGQNLLIPVDARIEDETSIDFETISVDFIMRQMSKDVKVQMVFLDACRDNPLARTSGAPHGAEPVWQCRDWSCRDQSSGDRW